MRIEEIEISVTRKKMKRVRLSVLPPEGAVRISAPYHIAETEIRAFALSKLPWIRRQISRIQSLPQPAEPAYVSGETHFLFGDPYRLKILRVPGKGRVVAVDSTLFVTATEKHRELVNLWLREQLRTALPPLFAKWEALMGVGATEVRIRDMKTRWGTCNMAAKRIWINFQLVKYPVFCLEYVVVHELAHLLEPSHNQRFTAIMDRFLPDWQQRKKSLRSAPGAAPAA